MMPKNLSSDFLNYLAETYQVDEDCERLPSLTDLSKTLGVSVSSLREQMEVGRALGLVEAKPRTGLRRLPYSFTPAVEQSLSYAITIDYEYFLKFADLRRNLEAAYWHQAVNLLTDEDKLVLKSLVDKAWEKLRGTPIQIPQYEHRQLHLTIYKRLDNPFVSGILEAYWEAYEAVGLNLYAGYQYLEEVWTYHQHMVDSICSGDLDAGYQALIDHTDLIRHRVIEAEDGKIMVAQSSGELTNF
ncbi:MAG: FadR family transcriptional regulator [Chloroflexota bacterium]|nr:MAG: FadR family transcriptional regulator [Chloroflexota bacterium]